MLTFFLDLSVKHIDAICKRKRKDWFIFPQRQLNTLHFTKK